MYYLKLSGYIPESKQMEFEQTYRFITTQIPKACKGYNITKDVIDQDVYHFVSYWSLLAHLQSFSKSASFLMMMGAFRNLGELQENATGEMIQEN
jgi:hypothetical protein